MLPLSMTEVILHVACTSKEFNGYYYRITNIYCIFWKSSRLSLWQWSNPTILSPQPSIISPQQLLPIYMYVHSDMVYVIKCAWMWEKCTPTTHTIKPKLHWFNPLDLLILLLPTSLLTQDQLQKIIKGVDYWNKSGIFSAAFLLCVFLR